MKKQKNKQGIKASKLAKAENKLKKQAEQMITVKNAEGEPDTQAKILIQNKVNYTPKVSVIIPVYNVEEYLRECLDSVINQTLKEIEIICVDDGSTDSSLEILKEYAKNDNRISVLTQENLHAGVARNAGLAVAKGEYVHFLDSDDWIEKETYQEVLQDINSSDIGIFKGIRIDYKLMQKVDMTWLASPKLNGIYNTEALYKNLYNLFSPEIWNKLYKLNFLRKFNLYFQSIISCNDVYFSYAALGLSQTLSVKQSMFYHYRFNTGKQITSIRQKYPLNILYALNGVRKTLEKNGKIAQLEESLQNAAVNDIVYSIKKCNSMQYISQYAKFFTGKRADEYICAIKKTMTIPIVFATNDQYARYVPVTIYSILCNSDTAYTYEFYIFHTGLLTSSKKLIENIPTMEKHNYQIKFINLKKQLNNITLYSKGRFSAEMWYRLFIPEALKEYKKAIYLDCDLIVQGDIAQLYNKDIGQNYLGACRNFVTTSKERLKKLNIPIDKYFNSGVLVFNIEEWNKKHIKQACLDAIPLYPNLDCPDQDILNIVCKGKIKYFDYKWNFTWHFLWDNNLSNEDTEIYQKAQKEICIIHYTSGLKPWKNSNLNYADIWWKYAKEVKIKEAFQNKSKIKNYLLMLYNLCQKVYLNQKYKQLSRKNAQKQLSNTRIDIKNFGNKNNAVEITTSAKVSQPDWFVNTQGIGQVVSANNKIQNITIKSIQDGKLRLDFKGIYKNIDGKNFPVWADYKSIKIDGKEILSAPIATWHDKPFRYEMPVKDGQIVKVEVVQQYHQYSKDELKDVILKLNPNSEYIKENIEKLTNKIYKKITVNNTTIKSSPQTTLFARVKQNVQEQIKLWQDKLSFAHKIAPVMDLMQKNQAQTLQILQEIQTKNVNLENKNNELKKEIEVLKGFFSTQLSDFKKQQEERSKQLMATGDRLSAELQRATAELQSAEQSQASEIKATLSEFIAQLAVTENKLSAELQRATAELQSTEQSQASEIKATLSDFIAQLAATENKLSAELQRATNELQSTEQTQASEIRATLSDFIAQLAATENKLTAELQRATEKLQNSGISEISEIKTYCADFAQYLDNAQAKMLSELNNQRETALQNKNNIIAGINQTEQSLQIQVAKSQELAQEQQNILDRVQERLEDLSVLKEIDFAKKEELKTLSQDIEQQKTQLLEKVQNSIDEFKEYNSKANLYYKNPFEVKTRTDRGLCDMTSLPDFEDRFRSLIKGLKTEDVATIVNIIKRLQLIKNTNQPIDLFSPGEKAQLRELKQYYQMILKVSDNLYCYKNYFLPINHFEASVFYYQHGLSNVNNKKYFADKDILDIGAFIGDSALILSPLTTKKVYCFEAMTENYNLLQQTIKLNNLKNIETIKSAVGSEKGEIEILYNGSGSSSDDMMVANPKYKEKCSVVTIDEYVKEHNLNVGLIKVDIEGAEQSFLQGAIRTIKEQKPTLLISIYHNTSDFLDIKPIIEGWNVGYKFKIFKPVLETVSGETLLICEQ